MHDSECEGPGEKSLEIVVIELGDRHHCIRSFVLAAFTYSASFGFLVQADDPRGRR